MKRSEFLYGLVAAGTASMIPGAAHAHDADHPTAPLLPPVPGGGCVLVPTETAGPYPLDLSGDSTYFRSDIRETQAGVDHRFRMRILGLANCLGMPNCRVDVWHCNADGYYSGYTTSAHLGTQNHVSDRFLRGIQLTDANGEVEFLTKFPGWYPGRTVHVHFQVFIGSMLQATSQFTYPIAEKNALLTANAPYDVWGADPVDPSSDGIFSDGYAYQLATLSYNSLTNEYESFIEVTINGTGTTGLAQLEPETGGMFKLGQNHPNPYDGETTVPFSLKEQGQVTLELFDTEGRRAAVIPCGTLPPGQHAVRVVPAEHGIRAGNYVYQLSVANAHGTFRQCKMMTARK